MNKAVRGILIAGIVAGVVILPAMRGKVSVPVTQAAVVDEAMRRETDKFNSHATDSAIALLHTGDVVLRMGIGADSYLLSELSHRDKRFSHCGIVVIEDGKPWVYHSIGGEDNPDERLRRDPASFFFSPLHNTAISIVRYDNSKEQAERLTGIVKEYYAARPKFDMKFDLATDDKLYCSEFVYKAFNKAMKDTGYFTTTKGFRGRYVAIDDLYINPHAAMVFQIKFKQYLYHQN